MPQHVQAQAGQQQQGQQQQGQHQPGQVPNNAISGMPAQAEQPYTGGAIAAPQPDTHREGGEKALPRIAIHAFCERSETAGTIQATTQDWRMARTNLKIYMGGVPAAI